jgi:DNA-binding transcriptional regulator YhcF (GntR family)
MRQSPDDWILTSPRFHQISCHRFISGQVRGSSGNGFGKSRLECSAMRLWLSRDGGVSIREQLVTQVVLGILSDDLAPGQRLPSTRELARRFKLHANTVSAGYRQLERERWVEFRRGSGVYVRANKPGVALSPGLEIDQAIAALFRSARKLGVPLPSLRARLRQWLELQPPEHFLLIEPEEELRRILTAEIQQATLFPVSGCGFEDCSQRLAGAIAVALPNRAAKAKQLLPEGTELLVLQVRSVPASLGTYLPAPKGVLVGIASRAPDFLKLARTVLNAAGFHPDSLILRDARKSNWHRGLQQASIVACDSLTATALPADCRALPFPLISETSIAELRRYVEFIRHPLA